MKRYMLEPFATSLLIESPDGEWVRAVDAILDPELLARAYDLVMALAPDSRPSMVRWRVITDMYARLAAENAEMGV